MTRSEWIKRRAPELYTSAAKREPGRFGYRTWGDLPSYDRAIWLDVARAEARAMDAALRNPAAAAFALSMRDRSHLRRLTERLRQFHTRVGRNLEHAGGGAPEFADDPGQELADRRRR